MLIFEASFVAEKINMVNHLSAFFDARLGGWRAVTGSNRRKNFPISAKKKLGNDDYK
jgi:hypothetical protein